MFTNVFLGSNQISAIYLGNVDILLNTNSGVLNPYDKYLSPNEAILTGRWMPSATKGYDDSPTMYAAGGATATWIFSGVPTDSEVEIYVWIPGGTGGAKTYTYTITVGDVEQEVEISQGNFTNRWYKLGVIEEAKCKITVSLKARENNTRINAVRLTNIGISRKPTYDGVIAQPIFINQSGYDTDKPKRATIPNISDGEVFEIIDSKKVVKYTGKVVGQIADFTDFKGNNDDTLYMIRCKDMLSYKFKIKENYIKEISLLPALRFMDESRQDRFNSGAYTGYGWRDSHQFSFELNSLVLQYMSNPTYYKHMNHKIHLVETCEYEELREQNEPTIIWLIKFGALRYCTWATDSKNAIKLHALIKGQLAYFLYLYPHITEYVSEEFYRKILETTIKIWGDSECTKAWYDLEGMNHNLFTTQNIIGEVKGQLPPGYAVMPNLLMWEVAKREQLPNAQDYFNAFYNNCNWLVNEVDLGNPAYTKGQRMSEYITMTSLCQAYEMYPDLCPSGTYEKIERVADVFISRSNNLWDLRQYSTIGDITNSPKTVWTGGGTMNEPGNVAGFPGVCYAMARIIKDEAKVLRLKELAIAHIDNVFGRNPYGRHFGFDAAKEIEGVDLGWFTKHEGGFGALGEVYGRIDGSPKEAAYPYNPGANYGYTEGWVAFNTAWNTSLAYLCGEDKSINDGLWIFAK